MKRGIAAVAIAEALSGLGNQVEDTSGLLIVNSKIYSISDILTKLAKMAATPGQRMSAISVRGMQKPTPENEGLVEKNPFVGAYRRNWAVYHRELNKTISF